MPVIVTTVPAGPPVGVNEVMVGTCTVKLPVETAMPLGVVTVRRPVVEPTGTVAVIWVAETTVNTVATAPLNVTRVVPVKLLPLIVTTVPGAPVVGENEEMDGAGGMVKLVAEVAVPNGVVTAIGPVTAPMGTVTVIWVGEFTE